jgi:hypothetical protein
LAAMRRAWPPGSGPPGTDMRRLARLSAVARRLKAL